MRGGMTIAWLALCLLGITSCTFSNAKNKGNDADGDSVACLKVSEDAMPEGFVRLQKAYPYQHLAYRDNRIVFPDGATVVYDDGRKKDFMTMLDESDVEDMFSLPYDTDGQPDYLADAGRSRCDALFKKMYGASESEVRKNLVPVSWFGQNIMFTSVNRANKQLEKVACEISDKYPELKRYMKCCGTFYWRKVRGANRQSAHSYGIAIDINTEYSDYWLWKNGRVSETQKIEYQNRIPLEIVSVFEKYGFVWGGRWYHYDTMHFEYRPEILN